MRDLFQAVLYARRPSSPPPRSWRDWALIGAIIALAVLEGVLRPDLPWRILTVTVIAGIAPTLLWRRTRPLLMLLVAYAVSGTLVVLIGADPEMYVMIYFLIMPYSLARWGSGREVAVGLAVIVGYVGVSAAAGRTSPGDALGGILVVACAVAVAAALRSRSGARAREMEQVKLLERERLARDLHDTVAHHVSAMAIRAQAGLAVAASQPHAAIDELRVIEAEAARALVELRAMVHVLRRDDPAELAPRPGLADLPRLASRPRHGPIVEVGMDGNLDDIAPVVGTAIYRLAQESVTNARRHARRATRINVQVSADNTVVNLRVNDDGAALESRPPSRGFGLIGMTERAELLGGYCQAGPEAGRGWTVTVSLPRNGAKDTRTSISGTELRS